MDTHTDIETGGQHTVTECSPLVEVVTNEAELSITVKIVTIERTLDVTVAASATVSELKAAIREVASDISSVLKASLTTCH